MELGKNDLLELFFLKSFRVALIIFFSFIIFIILKYFIKNSTYHYLLRTLKGEEKEEREKREKTLNGVFISALKAFITAFSAVLLLFEIGILNTAPFAALAGFFGLAFGLGAQSLAKDLINGFFIITEDHFRKGDSIKVDTAEGVVRDINLRRTVLEGLNGNIYYIPNSEIKITQKFKN